MRKKDFSKGKHPKAAKKKREVKIQKRCKKKHAYNSLRKKLKARWKNIIQVEISKKPVDIWKEQLSGFSTSAKKD